MENKHDERNIRFGHRTVRFPSDDLQVLTPCNHLLDDIEAIHHEMDQKGYLFIKGLHDREDVLAARLAVLEYIDGVGDKLDPSYGVHEGVLKEGCGLGCVPFMEGRNEISHKEKVLAVFEGPRPFAFFKRFFDSDVKSFDYKWLRAMHKEGFTGAHVDNVYMSRGSPKLLTMWTPVGDVPVENGVLAVCESSNRLPEFDKFQETYGNMDAEKVNLKGTGWFTEDPFEISKQFGGQWKTTDFEAGDVLIFNMRTVHMSTTNTTHFARISCDTRWQPSHDALDPRFNGDFQKNSAKYGLVSKMSGVKQENTVDETTIEALKKSWGF